MKILYSCVDKIEIHMKMYVKKIWLLMSGDLLFMYFTGSICAYDVINRKFFLERASV